MIRDSDVRAAVVGRPGSDAESWVTARKYGVPAHPGSLPPVSRDRFHEEPRLEQTRILPRAGEPPLRQRRGRPGRRVGRVILWLIVLLLVFLLVLLGIGYARIDKVDAIPRGDRDAVSAGRVYLLIGSDSREDLSPEERRRLGTGSAAGRRTDTIMLLHVPRSGRPALVSVPRDSLVEIPGRGRDRINAAFAFGGPKLLVETLESATGVRIDDYVEVGFGGFANIVDALGGVELCLEKPISDEKAHIDLPAGCQVLDGPAALGYARARYFDPRGDLGRVERQREVTGAIVDKAKSPLTLLNPVRTARLALATGDALAADNETGPIDLTRFGLALARVSGDGGDTLTVPLGRVGNTVSWDREKSELLWDSLRNGNSVPAALLEE